MVASEEDGSDVVAKVSLPLYCLRLLTGRYLLVAGGGGAAKTGIKNGFEIIELQFDGKRTAGEVIAQYETGDSAVMNCTSFSNGSDVVLAAGLDGDLQLFQLRSFIDSKMNGTVIADKDRGDTGIRKRKNSRTVEGLPQQKPSKGRDHLQVSFKVTPLKKTQTDFSEKEEPFQKVVRACASLQLVVTGGVDGHLRVWKTPSLDKIHDIAAHSREIDDVDISPNGKKMVSISKDGQALVWNIKDGKKLASMEWSAPEKGIKYMYKRCRYGVVEGDLNKHKLYTIHNPVAAPRKPAHIVRWDTSKYIPESSVPEQGSLSALAVSDDGRFLAVGSMDSGSVSIWISFSLQKVKMVEQAHATFVTGVEFLPSDDTARAVSGDSDCSVVSISVDNCVKIHHILKPRYISAWTAGLLVLVAMCCAFLLCALLGL